MRFCLIGYGEGLKAQKLDFWTKVDRISRYMRRHVLPNRDYDSPSYLALLEHHRDGKTPVPLSKYIQCRSGVCREYSLLTHILLRAAGISNQHVYASVRQASVDGTFDSTEDHGFTVAEFRGKRYVIDPYNENFHRYLLEDLQSTTGITEDGITRQILDVHDFPLMWVPKQASNCGGLSKIASGS